MYCKDQQELGNRSGQWSLTDVLIGNNDPTGGTDTQTRRQLLLMSSTGGCLSTCCSGFAIDTHCSLRPREDKCNFKPRTLLLLRILFLVAGIGLLISLPLSEGLTHGMFYQFGENTLKHRITKTLVQEL